MQVNVSFPSTLSPEDLEFLRQVKLLIGACQHRMNFIQERVAGGSAYAVKLTNDELYAAYQALGTYIKDRSGRGY
jgi:hypothetical protein